MNFKVITYRCGCKYIFITNPEKQTLKDHKFCPIHGKLKKHVMLWCQDCGVELIETGLLAWQRKKRCLECAKLDQRKRTKENWRKWAKEYNIKRRTPKTKERYFNAALENACKETAFKKLYRSMDRVLPVVETPMLDRWISESP